MRSSSFRCLIDYVRGLLSEKSSDESVINKTTTKRLLDTDEGRDESDEVWLCCPGPGPGPLRGLGSRSGLDEVDNMRLQAAVEPCSGSSI